MLQNIQTCRFGNGLVTSSRGVGFFCCPFLYSLQGLEELRRVIFLLCLLLVEYSATQNVHDQPVLTAGRYGIGTGDGTHWRSYWRRRTLA